MKRTKKVNKAVALAVKKVTGAMADMAYGASSLWGVYQPKEPKKISRG